MGRKIAEFLWRVLLFLLSLAQLLAECLFLLALYVFTDPGFTHAGELDSHLDCPYYLCCTYTRQVKTAACGQAHYLETRGFDRRCKKVPDYFHYSGAYLDTVAGASQVCELHYLDSLPSGTPLTQTYLDKHLLFSLYISQPSPDSMRVHGFDWYVHDNKSSQKLERRFQLSKKDAHRVVDSVLHRPLFDRNKPPCN